MLSVFIPWLNIKSEFVNCQIFFWESNVSNTPICQIQPFVIMEDFRSLIACDTFFSGFPLGSSNQFIMITVTCNSISLSFSNQYTFRYLGATRIGHCVIGSTPMILIGCSWHPVDQWECLLKHDPNFVYYLRSYPLEPYF